MPKKTIDPKSDANQIHFCTECGAELDNFFLDEKAADLSATTEHHHNCRKTGKFKGDMCSRIFIAEPIDPETLKDEE